MVRLVQDIKGADKGAAGLLIECRAQTPEGLKVPLLFYLNPLYTFGMYLLDET